MVFFQIFTPVIYRLNNPSGSMKLTFTSAFLFLIYTHATAQNGTADAILKKIRQSKEDTNKVLAYIEYGQFMENENLDSAGKYYLLAGKLSDKLRYATGRFKFRSNYTYI